MGAKTWMLVYAAGSARDALAQTPALDRQATEAFAAALFPGERLVNQADTDLTWTNPPDDEIRIGCFPGVSVVAAKEFAIDHPSRLQPHFLEAGQDKVVTLHAMHSVVDWFALAQWRNGVLIRSLSLSPDSGVLEDLGARLPFEAPYWAGDHPAIEDEEEDYPFPFHPLDLAEAALGALFGYQLEGAMDDSMIDPETIPLMSFKRRAA